MTIVAFPSNGKKRNDKSESYLETRINRNNAVEGEMLIYEVVLISANPNIAGIELSQNPSFDNLPASRSAADHRLSETEIDNTKSFSVVIDRFFIGTEAAGKHKLKGGYYRIGYNKQVQRSDPFWGPYITNSVDVVELAAPDLSVSITKLPQKGMPEDFSGAIGDFSVEVEVPSNELYAGEGAYAIVTITGNGDLSNAKLPDVRSIFNDSLQFKSMTESRSHFVKDGNVVSEIEIECTFTPHGEGEFDLAGCEFSFYNPDKKRYESVKSNPVTVKVVKEKSPGDSPAHYMDI